MRWWPHSIPYGKRRYRPGHPWLQRTVANAQQQRRRVVEAPFVGAAQIAVPHFIRQEIKRIEAVEQRQRCRIRRQGGIGGTLAAEAVRHAHVMTAEQRLLRRRVIGCLSSCAWRRVSSAL